MRRVEMKADSDTRLLKLAAREGLSYEAVMAALRKKDVRVNGAIVKTNAEIKAGDEVVLYVRERTLDTLYSDDNIIIANKPQGIATTQAEDETLEDLARAQFGEAYACHRLDRNTGGLVILARNGAARAAAEAAIKARLIEKRYACIVRGTPVPGEGEIRLRLEKTDDGVKIVDKGGVEALTVYKTLRTGDGLSLVEALLITGRTHQIRVSMASIGTPILGDDKYGDRRFNRAYGARMQSLWATKLTLNFGEDNPLSYLNGRTFESEPHFIKKAVLKLGGNCSW